MRRDLAVLCGGLVCLLGVVRADRVERQSQGFRAGTDLIPVDVSVLDRDRRPVRGLTAADFEIFEDGEPRPIVAFTTVQVPAAPSARPGVETAAWVRDAPRDVVSNDVPPEGRLVAILLDRTIPNGESIVRAREIARAAVDGLGPGDLAAVVRSSGFSNDGRFQGFTADRDLLHQAIDAPMMGMTKMPEMGPGGLQSPSPVPTAGTSPLTDVGDCYCGLCEYEAIGAIARGMRDAPRRRKLLLFVGSAITIQKTQRSSPCFDIVEKPRAAMMRELEMSNITVHTIDPAGLITTFPGADFTTHGSGRGLEGTISSFRREDQQRIDNLKVLPAHTGGRTVVHTSDPAAEVPAILAESGSYYLLGFEPRATPQADGAFHPIEVRVKRRNVTVHTRSGYAIDPPEASRVPADLDDVADLVGALDRPLPLADLPLSLAVAPFASSTPGEAAVAVVTSVQLPLGAPGTSTRDVTVLAGAFDRRGQIVQLRRQTLQVPISATSAAGEDLLSRLDLPAGQYDLRVAVRDEATGAVGSAFTFLDVPALDQPVSLSGLVVRRPSGVMMPQSPMADQFPFVPTAERVFTSNEPITAFAAVYQRGAMTAPVTIAARIVDATGATVFSRDDVLDPTRFEQGRAEYELTLPLSTLTAGDYLLTIGTSTNPATPERQLRFSVQSTAGAGDVDPGPAERPVPGAQIVEPTAPAAPARVAGSSRALDVLLSQAATRAAELIRTMSTVVAQEDYRQVDRKGLDVSERVTRSDLAVVEIDDTGAWVPLRDVFEVDGRSIRDREERLTQLLGSTGPDAVAQAEAIATESARLNLNAYGVVIDRTVNTPLTPLLFLLAANQPRSSFEMEGTAAIDGTACTVVTFTEEARPSLVRSIDGAASGRFWIETDTGRVLKSELQLRAALDPEGRNVVHAALAVTYRRDPDRGLWLAATMTERYDDYYLNQPTGRQLNAHADYSHFRQFGVSTSEAIR